MKTEYKNLNQTELGKLFGVSSHVLGDWLVDIGLRTSDKKPSAGAFSEGFVEQADNGRGGYF